MDARHYKALKRQAIAYAAILAVMASVILANAAYNLIVHGGYLPIIICEPSFEVTLSDPPMTITVVHDTRNLWGRFLAHGLVLARADG